MTPTFMFATGIENSYPTIHNGRDRVDEMEKCGHCKYWKTDFEKVQELGICFIRYGPPFHRTFVRHTETNLHHGPNGDEAYRSLGSHGIR